MKSSMSFDQLSTLVNCASGKIEADILFTNCRYVNVWTESLEKDDIAIKNGYIVAVGNCENFQAKKVVDLNDRIICPSFVDSHIHLESAMVNPFEFEKAVIPHGTQAVVCDPHEIANVCGTDGIDYILDTTKNLTLDVFVNIPSCVPATEMDIAGAVLNAENIEKYFSNDRVLGLAELMDFFSTANAKENVIKKELLAINSNKIIDGHAPSINPKLLNAYITSGVANDHECSFIEEAIEKIKRGMTIFVREGTVCKDLDNLVSLFQHPYLNRVCLSSDDKHPGDLLYLGHIDYIVNKAINRGANPISVIKAGTINPCLHYGLKNRGAICPSYIANFFICSDLQNIKVEEAYMYGNLVYQNGVNLISPYNTNSLNLTHKKVYNSFNLSNVNTGDVEYGNGETKQLVIDLIKGGVLTNGFQTNCKGKISNYSFGVDVDRDIVKIVNFERHKDTGHKGFAFLHSYGLKEGAIASTVSHDSHNLLVVGVNDADIALAANTIRESKGGLAVVNKGKVLGVLPLPIAGLMSDMSVSEVDEKLELLKEIAFSLGVNKDYDPFMTLAFMALPVIPKLKLTSLGLVYVNKNVILSPLYNEMLEEYANDFEYKN